MRKIKKAAAITMACAMAMSMMACGSKQEAAPAQETTAKAEAAADGTEAAPAEVDKSQRLIIYTNSGSNGRDAWLKERAAQDGYNIEVIQVTGSDLANRIVAEKNNPQADMVFGLNSIEYEKLKREEVLDQWKPVWADEVDMTLGDADGYYYPIVIQPLVNIMKADLEEYPTDYTDLVDEKWNDKYTILNFAGGTGKTILSGLCSRYRDDNGEFGVSEEGWEFIKAWIQNGHMAQEGEDNVGNVISGERPISGMWGSGVIQNQNERDYTFKILAPEVGVPYVTEQVAMISGSKQRDLAIDFANWFGSAEIQTDWMKEFGTIPCQPAAMEQVSDDIKEFVDQVHPQDMDWGFVSENVEQWVEKCELEFVK